MVLYVSSEGRYLFPHFRHRQQTVNMNRYTNTKLVDIHFIYNLANGSEHVTVRLNGERYSMKWQTSHQTLA
ncbi:hypothetical protein TNCV_5053491 [Trichonephila clavipes]|nr:hypothetical protein TNCV_5053491 [Trichonephila clavipes]